MDKEIVSPAMAKCVQMPQSNGEVTQTLGRPVTGQPPVRRVKKSLLARIILFFVEYYKEKEENPIFNFFRYLAAGFMLAIFCSKWSNVMLALPLYIGALLAVPAVYIITLVGELLFCMVYVICCLLRKAGRQLKRFYFFLEDLVS